MTTALFPRARRRKAGRAGSDGRHGRIGGEMADGHDAVARNEIDQQLVGADVERDDA